MKYFMSVYLNAGEILRFQISTRHCFYFRVPVRNTFISLLLVSVMMVWSLRSVCRTSWTLVWEYITSPYICWKCCTISAHLQHKVGRSRFNTRHMLLWWKYQYHRKDFHIEMEIKKSYFIINELKPAFLNYLFFMNLNRQKLQIFILIMLLWSLF